MGSDILSPSKAACILNRIVGQYLFEVKDSMMGFEFVFVNYKHELDVADYNKIETVLDNIDGKTPNMIWTKHQIYKAISEIKNYV